MPRSMIKLIRLADIISIMNASFGFLAVLVLLLDSGLAFELQIRLAVSFIFLGLLADGLDGIIARKKGKSDLGEYIESMADMSSMIIAPAMVVLSLYQGDVADSLVFLLILLCIILFYVICGIIRLAAFHPLKYQKAFLGLPASAATLTLLIVAVFYGSYFYILPIMFIISLLMILPIPFPKPSRKMNEITAVLIILSLLLWDMFFSIAPIMLLLCLLLYIFLGPLLQQKKHKESQ